MESLFRIHEFLIDHLENTVRRKLMEEIEWSHPMIGITGARGVGKTTFLLQYAKEYWGHSRKCLYVNMNNLYFQVRGLVSFAGDFYEGGGRVLLIDQVFKHQNWSSELRKCHNLLPDLRIVFTGSSVMALTEENPDLNGIVASYNLDGFSFREFLNQKALLNVKNYTLSDLLNNHENIAKHITKVASPQKWLLDYLHHGYYPFCLEKRNFSETILKTMNMMMEVDILLIKQIELKYLPKIKELYYLIAQEKGSLNVTKLSKKLDISRATVMNYIKYLINARLLNAVYSMEDTVQKKPDMLLLNNPNLVYAIYPQKIDRQRVLETFFVNTLSQRHSVNTTQRSSTFLIDGEVTVRVVSSNTRIKRTDGVVYTTDSIEVGEDNFIPIWMFGLLY